jgi:hypothetical protein
MTKVGDNNLPPKTPNIASYHADLQKNLGKFGAALKEHTTASGTDKERLKNVMDAHLALLQTAAKEIPIRDMHKMTEKLAKDYHDYLHYPSAEHFAALRQDIETLGECNQV